MQLYVELWKPRATWLALSREKRQEYCTQVAIAIEQLIAQGIELVGFALNDSDTPHRASYGFVAVWKMPNVDLVAKLEQAVEDSHFHEYFEQVNARGELVTADAVLSRMVTSPQ